MAEGDLTIPYPPDDVFANRSAVGEILREGNITYDLDITKPKPIEYPQTGGILIHITGAKYPKRGFPFPEAIWAINLAKKFFVALLKILTIKGMRGWLFVGFLPFKKKVKVLEQTLEQYNRLAYGAISPFILKERYLTPCAGEVIYLSSVFLTKLGISNEVAAQTADILGTIIEYDNAYRFRLQDIMSETTSQALFNTPRKEINRLIDIWLERELSEDVKVKVKKIQKLLNLAFRSSKVKEAFRQAIMTSILPNLQADAADRYWMDMKADYNYNGIPYADRKIDLLKGYIINV